MSLEPMPGRGTSYERAFKLLARKPALLFRMVLIYLPLTLIVALSDASYKSRVLAYAGENMQFILVALCVAAILVLGFPVFKEFIEGGANSESITVDPKLPQSSNPVTKQVIDYIDNRIEGIEFKALEMSDQEREKLREDLNDRLFASIMESAVGDVTSELMKKAYIANVGANINKSREDAVGRLKTELTRLNGRSTVNLFIGTITTIAGIIILAYYVIGQTTTNKTSWMELAILYLPKLSILVFIQIFAFFFLRLYRSTLEEVKYYQNEITTLESKILAMDLALQEKDVESLKHVIEVLLATDRNIAVNSTAKNYGLEVRKVEQDGDYLILERLKDFVAKYGKS